MGSVGNIYRIGVKGEFFEAKPLTVCEQIEGIFKTSFCSGDVIIINLTKATYLGGEALQILVNKLKKAQNLGGDLWLIFYSKHIRRTFEITGLDKVFVIYHSEEEIACLSQSS